MEMNFSGHYQHEAQQGKSGKDSPPTPQFPLCRCITVLTPLILQCVGRAEVGFSKEKLIISPYSCLTVSVQNVIDVSVMTCIRYKEYMISGSAQLPW